MNSNSEINISLTHEEAIMLSALLRHLKREGQSNANPYVKNFIEKIGAISKKIRAAVKG